MYRLPRNADGEVHYCADRACARCRGAAFASQLGREATIPELLEFRKRFPEIPLLDAMAVLGVPRIDFQTEGGLPEPASTSVTSPPITSARIAELAKRFGVNPSAEAERDEEIPPAPSLLASMAKKLVPEHRLFEPVALPEDDAPVVTARDEEYAPAAPSLLGEMRRGGK